MAAREIVSIEVWDAKRNARLPVPGAFPVEYDLYPYVVEDDHHARLGEVASLRLVLHTGSLPVVADPVYLARRRVLRVIYSDSSFREYRIVATTRELSGDSPPEVRAQSLWGDLDTQMVRRVTAGGFVSVGVTMLRRPAEDLLEAIMEDAPAPFAAGSAGTFAGRKASLRSVAGNHLALLLQLCQELGAEWEEVWDPVAGVYRINLVEEVGGPGVRPIEMGATHENRRTLKRDSDGRELFTRVVPLAGPDEEIVTIARATWPVVGATYAGGQTTLQLGGDPIWVDGMPFGHGEAGEFGTDGQWYPVASTAVPATVVVTGDARALTGGRFRLAGGTDLITLADPAAEAEAGIVERPERRSDIAPFANLLEEAGVSADLTEWAGGMPVGTSRVGSPTVTPTTDPRYTQAGGMAALVEAAQGEGIETAAVVIQPTSDRPYYSVSVGLRVLSGGVRLEVIGSDGKSYPVGDAATSSEDLLRALPIGGIRPPAGGTRIRITALKAGSHFAVDSWTLTQSATPYDYAPEMGPQALWHAGGRLLAADGGFTPDTLEGEVIDISQLGGPAADEIVIGSRVQVIDSGLDLETRVVELRERNRGRTDLPRKTVVLSRRRRDLIDYLSPEDQPRRRLQEGGSIDPIDNSLTVEPVEVTRAFRRYSITRGAHVAEVWIYAQRVPVASPATPWPAVGGVPTDILTDTTEYVIDTPPLGFTQRVRLVPMTSDLMPGPSVDIEVHPLSPEAPVVTVQTRDGATASTAWIRLQERGIRVLKLEVQTQVGDEPPGDWRAPYRAAGAGSYVQGGTLGPGEWEHDVLLHSTRFSRVSARAYLETGELLTIAIPPFDRNDLPTIDSVDVEAQRIRCYGDSDVVSWRVFRTDGGEWEESLDGVAVTFNPPIPAAATWPVTIEAFGIPAVSVTPDSPRDSVDRVVRGAEVPPPGPGGEHPAWGAIHARAPQVGSSSVSLTLLSMIMPDDDPPLTDYTVRVWHRSDYGSGWGHLSDITTSLDPVPHHPSGDGQFYTWSADKARAASGLRVTHEFRAEILLDGVVVDGRSVQVSWPYGAGGGGREPLRPVIMM